MNQSNIYEQDFKEDESNSNNNSNANAINSEGSYVNYEPLPSGLGKRKKPSHPNMVNSLPEENEEEISLKEQQQRNRLQYQRMGGFMPPIMPIYDEQVDSLPPSGLHVDYSNMLARPLSNVILQSTYGQNFMKAFPFANAIRQVHSRHHVLQPLGSLPQYLGKKNTQNRAKRRCKLCSTHCSFYCEQCSVVDQGQLICFCNPFTTAKKPCYFTHLDSIEGILGSMPQSTSSSSSAASSSSSKAI